MKKRCARIRNERDTRCAKTKRLEKSRHGALSRYVQEGVYASVLGQNAVKKACREDKNCRKKKENVV